MAGEERLVLASLVIDPTGVVTGVAQVNSSLATGGARLETFGKQSNSTAGFMGVLTNRMFSLRTAAVAD